MPATFKLVLAARADGDGLHDVRLRITVNRVVRFQNTGVALAAKHWNPNATRLTKNWVRTAHRDHAALIGDLERWHQRADKLAQRHPGWSADQLKAALRNGDLDPDAPDFIAFCRRSLAAEQARLEAAFAKGRPTAGLSQGTIDTRSSVVTKFADWAKLQFSPDGAVPFPALTVPLFKKYEQYLFDVLDNGGSTVVKNLKQLHIFIGEAVRAKLLSRDDDPLEDYEYPATTSRKVWMEQPQLHVFETVPLPPQQDVARRVYFLQYHAHGSRIGAMLRLKWKDWRNGRLTFSMDKGDRQKDVVVTPELAALLNSFRPAQGEPDPDAFILPFLPANYAQLHPREQIQETKNATGAINMNLKRASAKFGFTKALSTHVARRTLATLAERRLGGDLRLVGGLLGHTNTRTTQIYLDGLDTHTVDAAARTVYEGTGGAGTTAVQHLLNTSGQPASNSAADTSGD